MDPITLIALAGLGFAALQLHAAKTAKDAPPPPAEPPPVEPPAPDLATALTAASIVLVVAPIIEALTEEDPPDIPPDVLANIVQGISSGVADDVLVFPVAGGTLLAGMGQFNVTQKTMERLGIPGPWTFHIPARDAISQAIDSRKAVLAAIQIATPVPDTLAQFLTITAGRQDVTTF